MLKQVALSSGASPAIVTTGELATETAIKHADLSNVRILAFATHGFVAVDLKGLSEPALVFMPLAVGLAEEYGLLRAADAAQLKLSADWVILSACNTASGDGKPGADRMSGLAGRSFAQEQRLSGFAPAGPGFCGSTLHWYT